MIQFFSDFDKSFSQKSYDEFIEILNLSSLRCSSCELLGDFTKHAYYTRQIIIIDGKVTIKILRVQCGRCNATHALLPSQIVPYSQISLQDQLEIITEYESGVAPNHIAPSIPTIDTWIVVYIIKQYLNHWKMRLISDSICLYLEIEELILSCFKHHDRQFMQVKCGRNCLFKPPT